MPRAEKKLIAFTLYPGVTPLDLVGPLTVLRPVGLGWPLQTAVVGERTEPGWDAGRSTRGRTSPGRLMGESQPASTDHNHSDKETTT